MFGLTGTERVGGADGCLSVEKNKKKTAFVQVKNQCFWGRRAFFCLTRIAEQRADGNITRAEKKRKRRTEDKTWRRE